MRVTVCIQHIVDDSQLGILNMLKHQAGSQFPFSADTIGCNFIVLFLGDFVPGTVSGQHPVTEHLIRNHGIDGTEIAIVGSGNEHLVEFIVHPVKFFRREVLV